MINNPFKENTTSHNDWEVLKDLKWHCTKCELKSAQAKTWQVWRQDGIQLDTDEKGNFYKNIYCETCQNKTIHRKLKSLKILEETNSRSGLSQTLAKKIKEFYKNEEAVFLREMNPKELEVDHKFPQIRWSSNEDKNSENMTEEDIKSKFILLTRSHNLLKSRYCEKCVRTKIRGNFPGIYFWYSGDKNWVHNDNDEKGCIGCFWHNPYKWREELQKILAKLKS